MPDWPARLLFAPPARARWRACAFAVLAASLLAGCSGGGGGGGAVPATSPAAFETAEYEASGLDTLNASSAYAAGASGAGETVAVIDTGIDVDHPELDGAIAASSIDIVTGSSATIDDIDGHGTAVAGIIAARRNGTAGHGVAYEADIMAIRADEPGSCVTECTFRQSDIAAATDHASTNDAGVINYSLGGAVALSSGLEAALGRAVDRGSIVVFAAGNDGAASPAFAAQFVGTDGDDGRALVVGALDQSGAIASFSARAGTTASSYLVAPGVQVLAPEIGGGSTRLTGTSFAAPQVSGAAALVLQSSPFLSPEQVVDILLTSATDLGDPGVDTTYGHGLLNLDAALGPLGEPLMPTGQSASAGGTPLSTSSLSLGAAFGPGPELGDAIYIDDFGRAFTMELDGLVEGSERRTGARLFRPGRAITETRAAAGDLTLALETLEPPVAPADPWQEGDEGRFRLTMEGPGSPTVTLSDGFGLGGAFGLQSLRPGHTADLMLARPGSDHLALAGADRALVVADEIGDTWTLRAGFTHTDTGGPSADQGARRATALELESSPLDGARISVQIGGLTEEGGLLGSGGAGAFALETGRTAFLGTAVSASLGPATRVFGSLNLGHTAANTSATGLLRNQSALRSLGFGAGIDHGGIIAGDDLLTLAVVQPLRVTSGQAELDVPVGQTASGEILRETRSVPLAPEGREIDVELGYGFSLDPSSRVSMNWVSRLEPDHDADAAPEHILGLRYRRAF